MSSPGFPFMDLPKELRTMIFKLFFGNSTIAVKLITDYDPIDPTPRAHPDIAVLLVSRAMNSEARPIFFSHATFNLVQPPGYKEFKMSLERMSFPSSRNVFRAPSDVLRRMRKFQGGLGILVDISLHIEIRLDGYEVSPTCVTESVLFNLKVLRISQNFNPILTQAAENLPSLTSLLEGLWKGFSRGPKFFDFAYIVIHPWILHHVTLDLHLSVGAMDDLGLQGSTADVYRIKRDLDESDIKITTVQRDQTKTITQAIKKNAFWTLGIDRLA